MNGEEIKNLIIPNGVTSIGYGVFSDCSGLTSVTIPNSVTSIGNDAFYKCDGLTSVTIPNYVNTIGSWAFGRCSGLTSVNIGNSVTSIGERAFYGCSGLTSVTIPNSVTSIGDYAFGGCDIPIIVSLIENPFAISNSTFSKNTIFNAYLYVPVGTIDKYKATEGWKEFMFIEENTENGVAQTMANTVMVQSRSGIVSVSGVNDGTNIAVYSVDGCLVGAARASSNQATVFTSLRKGEVIVVKIGEKSMKVIMQ